MRALITLTVCLLAAMPAWAAGADLKPSEVFATDAPSIVVVIAYGKDGKAVEQGSGVVIAKDIVVSNCHVIEKANSASVLYRNKRFAATLRYEDVEHDLCSFVVKGLSAPPVRMGSTSQVQVGDTAYAIGAPEGLDLTLSGGLISSLRKIPGGVVLQMTTPISPGSSGGGLFDSQARLIGITSYYMKGGEQLNFALPVEWIEDLPQRGKLASVNTERIGRTASTTEKSNLRTGIRAFDAGDYTAAFKILEPLVRDGNDMALLYVGIMYNNGYVVPQNYAQYAQAVAWDRVSAALGMVPAEYNLGVAYDFGRGVPQDYVQAVAWYRKAAVQGVAEAQSLLGLLYMSGQGVPQDYVAAYALLNVSAVRNTLSQERAIATSERTKLAALMTPTQVQAGQALTRKMKRIGVIKALDEYLNGGTQ